MVQFTHFFNVVFSREDLQDDAFRSTRFTTLYNYACYRWRFYVEPTESDGSLIVLNQDQDPEEIYANQIGLSFDSVGHYRIPVLNYVLFSVEMKIGDETIIPPNCEVRPPRIGIGSLRPPPEHPLNRQIEWNIFQRPMESVELRCRVVLDFDSKSFDFEEFKSAAPNLPLQSDFRYSAITDKSCHDLTIHCQDGIYTASRQALFLTSGYFRELFNRVHPLEIEERNVSVAAMHTVVVHIVTGTYSPPELLTPTLMTEIMTLNERYLPPEYSSGLSEALEKTACEHLVLCAENLDKVVEWTVSAASVGNWSLFHSASVILMSMHYADFLDFYKPGTEERSVIHQMVHNPMGFRSTSIYNDIRELRSNMLPAFERVSV